MILDSLCLFSDAQAVTASAASDNQLDTAAERYLGTGRTVFVVCQLDVAMTDSGSDSTVTVTVQSDTDSAFGSAATVCTVGTFAATSAIGTRLVGQIPADVATERYIRLYYTVANGSLSTGSITAYLTCDVQAYRPYADNITVQ